MLNDDILSVILLNIPQDIFLRKFTNNFCKLDRFINVNNICLSVVNKKFTQNSIVFLLFYSDIIVYSLRKRSLYLARF
jgi:hypothetical protein